MPYLYGITLARSPESGHHRADSDRNDNELRQTAADFTQPPVRTTVRELSTTEGRILIFRVGPSDYVHESQPGDCYQRIGDESRRLSFAQRQEREWDRGFASFDGTRAPEADISDLDSDHLRDFQELLGSSSPERALHGRELLTKIGHISVAAYVLLPRRPQTIFPSAHGRRCLARIDQPQCAQSAHCQSLRRSRNHTRARREDFRGDATHRAVRTDVRSIIPISPPDALGTQFTSQLH